MIKGVYPNPFNPETTISYILGEESFVELSVYNIKGQMVKVLVNEQQQQGEYRVSWNAENQSSGVYYIRMQSENGIELQKTVLIK
jgi:flagellar hook assembly protein FlgD